MVAADARRTHQRDRVAACTRGRSGVSRLPQLYDHEDHILRPCCQRVPQRIAESVLRQTPTQHVFLGNLLKSTPYRKITSKLPCQEFTIFDRRLVRNTTLTPRYGDSSRI
ncbi:hypothetical protein LIA77_09371 [Sarocladium implicatum]|nr:hypothetical protein LIA77_09371 [Sarocladium implicatum]